MAIRWTGIIRTDLYDSYLRDCGCTNTNFIVPRDTETLLRLVEVAIAPGTVALDLGCGDGLATVHAAGIGASVIGVDINPEAVTVARLNASRVDPPDGKVHIEQMDMSEVLRDAAARSALLERCGLGGRAIDAVISNPPYVPMSGGQAWQSSEAEALRAVPATDLGVLGRSDSLLATVATLRAAMIAAEDGGPDGLRFIREIIGYAPRLATRVAWLQASYTSPATVLSLIEEHGLWIDSMLAYATPFGGGALAQTPQAAHLARMRDDGEAFYWPARAGGPSWMLLLGFSVRGGSRPPGYDWPTVRASLQGLLTRFSERGPDILPFVQEAGVLDVPFDVEVACYEA